MDLPDNPSGMEYYSLDILRAQFNNVASAARKLLPENHNEIPDKEIARHITAIKFDCQLTLKGSEIILNKQVVFGNFTIYNLVLLLKFEGNEFGMQTSFIDEGCDAVNSVTFKKRNIITLATASSMMTKNVFEDFVNKAEDCSNTKSIVLTGLDEIHQRLNQQYSLEEDEYSEN